MKKYIKITISCFIIACLSLGSFRFYIEQTKSRKADLVFSSTHLPAFYTSLGHYKGPFIIDTGGGFFIKLASNLIDQIPDAEFVNSANTYNYMYTPMEYKEYFVKKINFFDLELAEFLINESIKNSSEYSELPLKYESVPWGMKNHIKIEKDCLIGHRFLMTGNFFLDFKNNIFKVFRSDITPIFSYPYFGLAGNNVIEFEYDREHGLLCNIDTSIGKKKMLIDTGSSVTVFKLDNSTKELIKQTNPQSMPTVLLNYFYVGSHDYGPTKVHVLEDLKLTSIDGILGMDFFHNKILFFDSQQRKIYVKN